MRVRPLLVLAVRWQVEQQTHGEFRRNDEVIPTIETICEDLKAGKITVQQAIAWLYQHAEGAANEQRDFLAAQFAAAWIVALGQRWQEPSCADIDILHEANRRGIEQADAMLVTLRGTTNER